MHIVTKLDKLLITPGKKNELGSGFLCLHGLTLFLASIDIIENAYGIDNTFLIMRLTWVEGKLTATPPG